MLLVLYAPLEKKDYKANFQYLLAQMFIKEINLTSITIHLKSQLSRNELIITCIGVLTKILQIFCFKIIIQVGKDLMAPSSGGLNF